MGSRFEFEGLHLGLDCGTQGLKALLLDAATGRAAASAARAYGTLPSTAPGVSEQNPWVWIRAARGAIREVVAKAGRHARAIRSLAVSAQQHGMVALDGKGRPVRPAKLWNDTSTAEDAKALTEAVGGPRRMLRLTGNVPPPGFTAPKVRWFVRTEPAAYARTAVLCLPHDYLNLWLTGELATEAGDASGTGYFDIRRRVYSEEVLDTIDTRLRNKVPPVVPPGSVVGSVQPSRARELGLPRGVLVGTGGGDNMMAALGTGATRPGIVVVSLGTSGTVFTYREAPISDPKRELASFCDSTGGYLPLYCVQNCTNATEIVRRLLGVDHGRLERLARRAPLGCSGARLLPYFGGERTPNLPDARASITGLTESNFDAPHLARLAYEGPTRALATCIGRLRALGVRPSEVRLTGGGAKSPFWRELATRLFGVPVVVLRHDEGAAYGAALCALWCAARREVTGLTADAVARSYVRTARRVSAGR